MASREHEHLIWSQTTEEIEKEKDWVNSEIVEIGLNELEILAIKASEARENSYAPYSEYDVGAALLTISGEIELDANVEKVTYSETSHAEENSVNSLASKGYAKKYGRKFVQAIAISHKGDTAPCGRCRQILAEFSDNCLIVVADEKGDIRKITSLKTMLPYAFSPSDLGKD